MGPSVEAGGSARVSDITGLGAYVGLSPIGTFIRLLVTRGGHKFNIPILLDNHPDIRTVVALAALPPAAYLAFRHFVLGPVRRSRWQGRLRDLLQRHQGTLLEAKEKASGTATAGCPWYILLIARCISRPHRSQAARDASLLEAAARRKLGRELTAQGLVVVRGEFGLLEELDVSER